MAHTSLPVELLYFVFAFLFAVFLITVLTPLTFRFGLTDDPCKRKRHSGSVPLVGGIVMFLVMAGLTLLILPMTRTAAYLLTASALVTLVGAYDDRFTMSYKMRLVAQVIAAFVIIYGVGNVLQSFGQIIPGVEVRLGYLAVPVTVLGIVGVINAYNLIDGMDGLAGGLALVAFVGLFVLLRGQISLTSEIILVFLSGALVAYLLFNLHVFPSYTTKVFMGDAGSTLLGLIIVAFLIRYTQGASKVFEPATALWLVAVPLTDMCITFFRRLRHGRSPFRPDRTHVHHIFQRARFSQSATLIIILLWATFLAAVGIFLERLGVPPYVSFGLFIVAFAIHAVFVARAWQISKFFYRLRR